jgi:hypothetical protein
VPDIDDGDPVNTMFPEAVILLKEELPITLNVPAS